jgi:hypothetical protein
VLGPLVGGLIGVNVYNYLFSPSDNAVAAAVSAGTGSSTKGVTVRRTTVRLKKVSRS